MPKPAETPGYQTNPLRAREFPPTADPAIERSSEEFLGPSPSGNRPPIYSPSRNEVEAANEHTRTTAVLGSVEDLKNEFGPGVSSYFSTLRYVMMASGGPAIAASICYVIAWGGLLDHTNFEAAMIGLFPPTNTVHAAWVASLILIYVMAGCSAGLYLFRHTTVCGKRGADSRGENDAGWDDAIESDDLPTDIATARSTSFERSMWRLLSAVIYVVLLAVQAASTFGLAHSLSGSSTANQAILIALFNSATTLLLKTACKRCTVQLEMHSTLTSRRHSNFAKLFALKLLSIALLYIVKFSTANGGAVITDDPLTPAEVSALACTNATATTTSGASPQKLVCGCPLLAMGWQFFWLLCIDIAFSTLGELALALAHRVAWRVGLCGSVHSDADAMPRFNTDEEYVGLFYRSFLSLFGAPVFPLLTAIATVSFALEWYCDKFRLMRCSRKDVVKEGPLSPKLIASALFTIPLAAVLLYPVGFVYILASSYGQNSGGWQIGLSSCNFFHG